MNPNTITTYLRRKRSIDPAACLSLPLLMEPCNSAAYVAELYYVEPAIDVRELEATRG